MIFADPMSGLPVSSDLPEVIDDDRDYIGMLSVDAVPHAMLWGEIQVASDFCLEKVYATQSSLCVNRELQKLNKPF